MSDREKIVFAVTETLQKHGIAIEQVAKVIDKHVDEALRDQKDAPPDQQAQSVILSIIPWLSQYPVTVSIADDTNAKTRLLFVGNSLIFENSLPEILHSLFKDSAQKGSMEPGFKISMVVQAGLTLEQHIMYEVAAQVIEEGGPWDMVVLQEQSTRPIQEPAKMFEYGQELGQLIRSAGAKPVVFSTWCMSDRPEDQNQISSMCSTLANMIDADLARVADCWSNAKQTAPSINLYKDRIHPSPEGSYLAACCFYSLFARKSPVGLSAVIPHPEQAKMLDPSVALQLQNIAASINEEIIACTS